MWHIGLAADLPFDRAIAEAQPGPGAHVIGPTYDHGFTLLGNVKTL